jgi:hypothetical protein
MPRGYVSTVAKRFVGRLNTRRVSPARRADTRASTSALKLDCRRNVLRRHGKSFGIGSTLHWRRQRCDHKLLEPGGRAKITNVEGARRGAAVQSEFDRLRANIDAIAALVRLAEQLRRTNARKWGITETEWQAAVQAVASAPLPHPSDSASVPEAIRAAHSAGGRLGNSGEARFGSVSVGRCPDSSRAGKRFYADLDSVLQRLTAMQKLVLGDRGKRGHPE